MNKKPNILKESKLQKIDSEYLEDLPIKRNFISNWNNLKMKKAINFIMNKIWSNSMNL